MTTVVCSSCGKENEPSANWNYCRGCGGRLAVPVREKVTAGAAELNSNTLSANSQRAANRESAPARVPMAKAAPPRKAAKTPPKTKQELLKDLRPWTYGLIVGLGAVGMIIGSVVKEKGVEYGLINDPFNVGMIGGIVAGGLIAQCMLWYRQSQQ